MAIPTRQKLVEAARQRFYRDGFRNVGLDQIISDVGISKTAFYKHFQSKEDLMLEVLTAQDQWLQQRLLQMIREIGGDSASRQLHAVFDVVEQIIESEDFFGCIFVNAAMEFPLPHDPVHEAAARNKKAIERIIHDIAERAGVCDPPALAKDLCLVIEGAYVTRHVTADPDTIGTARRVFENVLRSYRVT